MNHGFSKPCYENNLSLYTPVLLVTFFLSCSKSKADVQQPNVNSSILPGVWEYRFGYVQIANPNPVIFALGNGNIWKFSDNH